MTGTPANTLLEASRAKALIVAVVEPSLRMEAELLDIVRCATAVVAAEELEVTCTLTVAVSPDAVAVTVMVLAVGSPAVDSVAVAAPLESVVGLVTATPPESDANETVTPEIRSFFELRANTVIVAVAEPSEGMVVVLDIAVRDAGTTVAVVPVPVPVLVVDDSPVIDFELPPQPVSSATPIQAMIDNLRMS